MTVRLPLGGQIKNMDNATDDRDAMAFNQRRGTSWRADLTYALRDTAVSTLDNEVYVLTTVLGPTDTPTDPSADSAHWTRTGSATVITAGNNFEDSPTIDFRNGTTDTARVAADVRDGSIAESHLTAALVARLNAAGIPKVASDPTSPTEGDVWYNTTDNALRYSEGAGVTRTVLTDGSEISGGGLEEWQSTMPREYSLGM